tara:strand:+ start:4711 stop:5097 length:387 start_codon:yes stop_codon:yes gene_type:complete
MNIIEATTSGFTNIITFKGRASRSEFWWFYLVVTILNIIVGFIPYVGVILSLALAIATLSMTVRRFHDLGLSGWWLFVSLAPFVIDRTDTASGKSNYLVLFGFMYALKMYITKGENVENQYGPDPLAA